MELPPGAPPSPLFTLRETPLSGRAIFAAQDIPADTLVFRSADLVLSVVLREYRREVCGHCFSYEYGRDLLVRDGGVGFAFCSEECRQLWREEQGEVGVECWRKVEGLVRGRSREDSEMVDVGLPRPRSKEIDEAWASVGAQAELIRVARAGERDANTVPQGLSNERQVRLANGATAHVGGVKVTKQHRKALQKALLSPINPDVMTFCAAGLLWRYNHPRDWDKLLALAVDVTPYHNSDDLQAFTRTYLHLLSILPLPVLELCTPDTLRALSTRDSHNSFGIRSLEDDGSEFFGYGCWPSASYFNHSCGPNVEKRRVGRAWEFRTAQEVKAGEELCITYLSGEERKLSRGRRGVVLRANWGFVCGCERCEEL
ncbi:SET domain-containing protein [Lojkania enalia]|uniref:SET domain-containing protein n=1 Tax=Lojkania enalia TaxID=147567 RepID=A0A9P4KA20_9PLEO|nr:SET domain-containing protein [Didymosphaeria enalia]